MSYANIKITLKQSQLAFPYCQIEKYQDLEADTNYQAVLFGKRYANRRLNKLVDELAGELYRLAKIGHEQENAAQVSR